MAMLGRAVVDFFLAAKWPYLYVLKSLCRPMLSSHRVFCCLFVLRAYRVELTTQFEFGPR